MRCRLRRRGLLSVKGAGHPFEGPGGQAAALPALPVGALAEPVREIELHYHYDDLTPVVEAPYKVTFDNGTVLEGTLNQDGYKLLKGVPPGAYQVDYGEDSRDWKAPPLSRDDAAYNKKEVQQEGSEMIERALKTEPPIVGAQA